MKCTAKITSKGQITVPKKVRLELGVDAGDSIVLEKRGREFRLTALRSENPFSRFRGSGILDVDSGREAVIQSRPRIAWRGMTSVDTNVLVALLDRDEIFSAMADEALQRALSSDGLIVSAPVWAELRGFPARDELAFRGVFGTKRCRD